MQFLRYLLIIFCFVFLFTGNSYAMTDTNTLYKNYCPAAPYDLSNGFSRGIQTITGMNFIASQVAENEIKKNIKSFAQGNINVKVKSFSATDAKNGRFKSFGITGHDINIYSVYLSEVNIKSACNFIYLNLNSNPIQLKEPMAIDFDIRITEKDLNNMLKTATYSKYLMNVKFNNKNLKIFELRRPRVSLKNNKFHFALDIRAPFIAPFVFNIKSDLTIKDNRVNLANLIIGSNSKQVNVPVVTDVMNLLNPLWFAQLILQQHNCKFLLKNVKISNEKINVTGAVFLGKS